MSLESLAVNSGPAFERLATVAQYKHAQYLHKSDHVEYDNKYKPGTIASNSGIYRCVNCNDEIAANKGNPLPPQNHHQHADTSKPIEWQLLVFAQQQK